MAEVKRESSESSRQLLRDDIDAVESALPEDQTLQRLSLLQWNSPWPWQFLSSVLALASICLFIYIIELRQTSSRCSFQLDTDLNAARNIVRLHEKEFGGALTYNGTGNLILEQRPGDDIWVGTPGPELDKLWDRVESASMILLQGNEADMVRDRTLLYNGYWVTGLDVIHQLHCLNQIRKSFDPDYYMQYQSHRVERMHLDHCLDYIRQAIMCNSDITLVTHKWYESAQVFGPDFATRHTCKNFETLLAWSQERTTAKRDVQGRGSAFARKQVSVMERERLEKCLAKMKSAEHHH